MQLACESSWTVLLDSSHSRPSQGGESRRVIDIDRLTSTSTAATTATTASAASASAAAVIASSFPTATTSILAPPFASTTSATTSTRRLHGSVFNVDEVLLLALSVTLGLGSASRDEVVLLLVPLQLLGLRPFLIRLHVLVRLPGLGGSQGQPLGGELGEVLVVRSRVIFRLGLGLGGRRITLTARMMAFRVHGHIGGVIHCSRFLLGLSDGLSGLLILPFRFARRSAPALSDFLVGVTLTRWWSATDNPTRMAPTVARDQGDSHSAGSAVTIIACTAAPTAATTATSFVGSILATTSC